MNMITYRLVNYHQADDRRQVLKLYDQVFHMDFSGGYDKWYCREQRKTLGIAAVDEICGKIISHWALVGFDAVIHGREVLCRHLMGVMSDPEYRGKGIASNAFRSLREIVIDRKDTFFGISFPNDQAYSMEVNHLGYVPLRDYHFVVLPKGEAHGTYKLDEGILCEEQPDTLSGFNHLSHSKEYMLWRYQEKIYDKWRSENGHIFISTRFMDKADLLYWSGDASGEELLDFASFLYKTQGVERVTTWNTIPFLDMFPREARDYHMCINYFDRGPAEKEEIQREWFYYMGDCDLF